MNGTKPTTREKILKAAADVANESGSANLSLDAVAHRAGVSKGGLLYNFPSKAKLLQGLVESYIVEFEASLDAACAAGAGRKGQLMAAYLSFSADECGTPETRPSGILAAMAEDPEMLDPVRVHKRRLLDRLMAEADDPARMLTAFLVVEGLRSLQLLDIDVLTGAERQMALDSLRAEGSALAD